MDHQNLDSAPRSERRKIYLTDVAFHVQNIAKANPVEDEGEPAAFSVDISYAGAATREPLALHPMSEVLWASRGIINSSEDTEVAAYSRGRRIAHLPLQESDFQDFFMDDEFICLPLIPQDDEKSVQILFKILTIPLTGGVSVLDGLKIINRLPLPPDEKISIAVHLANNEPQDKRAEVFFDFALLSWGRFMGLESENTLQSAILAYDHALSHLPDGDPQYADFLNNKGVALMKRYERFGTSSAIDEAIAALEDALGRTSKSHTSFPRRTSILGRAYHQRFEHGEVLTDINRAISIQQEAARLASGGHVEQPNILTHLGTSLLTRFEHTGDYDDLNQTISTQRQAIQVAPLEHPNLAGILTNLGNSLLRRHEDNGNLRDLTECLLAHQRAVDLTPPNHQDAAVRMFGLGTAFFARSAYKGDLSDMHNAFSYLSSARESAPIGHPLLPVILATLGATVASCFPRIGDISAISELIAAHQAAIALTPDIRNPLQFNSLGNMLYTRFLYEGDLIDLSEAISAYQRAVHLTEERNPSIPLFLNNIGNRLLDRFKHTKDPRDIEEARLAHQKSLDLTPPNHAQRPARLSGLGTFFLFRYEHQGEAADSLKAIDYLEKAVRLTPEGHRSMHYHLSNLGNALLDATGDTDYLKRGISALEEAIDITPEGHKAIPTLLNNLATGYLRRYRATGNLEDISKAISALERAIEGTPKGNAHESQRLFDLGEAYLARSENTGFPDFQQALTQYSLAATSDAGPPSIRLQAARKCAYLHPEAKESLPAYRLAIELMSQVAGIDQTIERRHASLLEMSNFSTQAAAAALSVDDPQAAVEFLEQGRCLVWNQLNKLRSPADILRESRSGLADRFVRVARALEGSGSREDRRAKINGNLGQRISAEDETTLHLKLAREWDEVLEEIRDIDEFSDFLRPASCTSILQRLPGSGYVVIINVHKDRCDALALKNGADVPFHIPLENFSHSKASTLRDQLLAHLHNYRVRERELESELTRGSGRETTIRVIGILGDLWTQVANPILDGLTLKDVSPDPPRIWWCLTGPLAFLPIHAAGIYPTEPQGTAVHARCLADFAISSYIPTVTILCDRVKGARNIKPDGRKMIIISQPDTPNYTSIPGTREERIVITQLLRKRNIEVSPLEGNTATKGRVIDEIDSYSCIHLACHASQNLRNPMESGFALYDGMITLHDLVKKSLPNADLAFLSACQTSTGDGKLSEEAIHLAAGMLAVGYRGVVATMWSIKDQYGPAIAKNFYDNLLTDNKELGSAGAAAALHNVLKTLREKPDADESHFLTWVPYIHVGY